MQCSGEAEAAMKTKKKNKEPEREIETNKTEREKKNKTKNKKNSNSESIIHCAPFHFPLPSAPSRCGLWSALLHCNLAQFQRIDLV
jgi:hypothetical protein